MKSVFFALLRHNVFCGLAALIIAFIVEEMRSMKAQDAAPILIAIALWWLIGNVRILISNRKTIVHAVKDGGIEAAATALDVKDSVAETIKQRRKERAARLGETKPKPSDHEEV